MGQLGMAGQPHSVTQQNMMRPQGMMGGPAGTMQASGVNLQWQGGSSSEAMPKAMSGMMGHQQGMNSPPSMMQQNAPSAPASEPTTQAPPKQDCCSPEIVGCVCGVLVYIAVIVVGIIIVVTVPAPPMHKYRMHQWWMHRCGRWGTWGGWRRAHVLAGVLAYGP